ncbi:cobalamin B12-binding domain-containing protein [Pseudonocardia zijingensis]|uniref:Cobalamin B12-binding domain-containing protein n=1 Tax=Pseudonocardia zijingensis TaxID=153376 RepID=A0ABN1PZR1_9PSEU
MRRRVVLAKLGLDGHDVGVRLIGKHLAQAGFEVIYLGKRVPTAHIVRAAVQESADAVGLSCLSGGLGHFASLTVEGLREQGCDIPVLAGGIDEPAEIDRMLAAGVAVHFGPGASIDGIIKAFDEATAEEHA